MKGFIKVAMAAGFFMLTGCSTNPATGMDAVLKPLPAIVDGWPQYQDALKLNAAAIEKAASKCADTSRRSTAQERIACREAYVRAAWTLAALPGDEGLKGLSAAGRAEQIANTENADCASMSAMAQCRSIASLAATARTRALANSLMAGKDSPSAADLSAPTTSLLAYTEAATSRWPAADPDKLPALIDADACTLYAATEAYSNADATVEAAEAFVAARQAARAVTAVAAGLPMPPEAAACTDAPAGADCLGARAFALRVKCDR